MPRLYFLLQSNHRGFGILQITGRCVGRLYKHK